MQHTTQLREQPVHLIRRHTMLPGNVFDQQGRQVACAGRTVNRELIDFIKRRCGRNFWVGEDWPLPPEKKERPKPKRDAGLGDWYNPRGTEDDRKTARKSWCAKISVDFFDAAGKNVVRTMDVITHDLSKGGMSFVARAFIHPGTLIEATLEMLPTKPRVRAIVRNCEHVHGTEHRIGVQFVTDTKDQDQPTESENNA